MLSLIEQFTRGDKEPMTTAELHKALKDAGFDFNSLTSTVIESGDLRTLSGKTKDYTISEGWNILSASECQNLWTAHTLELLMLIEKQGYNEDELLKALESVQTEHMHWDWVAKSCVYKSDEYRWFYLYADKKPQGACLIYHPKESALSKLNIFYVEFFSSAPWNTNCVVQKREYLHVGSILLKAVLKYCTEFLKLDAGFSLHSLPQANEYYQKLNMLNVEKLDKGEMLYFELPNDDALKLLGAL